MGMVLVMKRVTDGDLERLRRVPSAIHSFVEGEEEAGPPSSGGLFATVAGWLSGAKAEETVSSVSLTLTISTTNSTSISCGTAFISC